MQNAHAILGPSSAYRWLVCTPSARFEQQQPNEESVYAEEGTLAHEVAALVLAARSGTFTGSHEQWLDAVRCLEGLVDRFYDKQDKPSEFASMYDYAEDYAAFVLESIASDAEVSVGAERTEKDFSDVAKSVLIEHKYDVFKYVPLGFGTADATVRTRRVLYVTDYKYGAGVRVSATNNTQGMLYGLGALEKAKASGWDSIETVVIRIYQPRAGGSSSWQISADALVEWGETVVKPKALQAIAGIGDFIAGEHCHFCKARLVCKAFYDRFAEVKKLSDKRTLTDADLNKVLSFGPALASWVKKVEEDAVKKLERGNKIKGFKLVKGRGRRSFTSEDNVVDALIGADFDSFDIFDTKLRSLTDLEKHLGKKKFNQLLGAEVTTVEGRPSLVPEDDDRPAIGKVGADEYDDEEDIL